MPTIQPAGTGRVRVYPWVSVDSQTPTTDEEQMRPELIQHDTSANILTHLCSIQITYQGNLDPHLGLLLLTWHCLYQTFLYQDHLF